MLNGLPLVAGQHYDTTLPIPDLQQVAPLNFDQNDVATGSGNAFEMTAIDHIHIINNMLSGKYYKSIRDLLTYFSRSHGITDFWHLFGAIRNKTQTFTSAHAVSFSMEGDYEFVELVTMGNTQITEFKTGKLTNFKKYLWKLDEPKILIHILHAGKGTILCYSRATNEEYAGLIVEYP